MRAAIVSIGDELVLGENVDTNSAWLSQQLAMIGGMTVEHRTVRDDRRVIAEAVGRIATTVDVLILTGGLGPTADDLTREGLGEAMDPGRDLVVDPEAVEQLKVWFEHRGRHMPESNRSQTLRPPSAQIIANPNGTAPGLKGRLGPCRVFALPGPPREMKAMFRDAVLPDLIGDAADVVLVTKTVSCFGIGEALAAEGLGDLLDRDRDPMVGITASESIVTARVRGRGRREDVTPLVDADIARITDTWHPYAYGSVEQTLSAAIGELLLGKGQTLTTAESCTGGWLGKLLVDVSGSSLYYLGGWVTYSDDMKKDCLGVPHDIIDRHGAVSEPCAKAMAIGALEGNVKADWSLAITGIAGPDGGTDDKPVGTVYIALGRKIERERVASTRRFEFTGDRSTIRYRSAQTALQMLRFALLDIDSPTPMLWELPLPEGAVGS